MRKKVILPSILIIFCSIAIAVFLIFEQKQSSIQETKIYRVQKHSLRPIFDVKRDHLTVKITIGAIGDILIHNPVYQDAFNGAGYNFDAMFEPVKSMLEKPDILTANQESILGGSELGLSGYPMFNSPHQVADALVHTGVDIVSTANNHSLDRGEKGIRSESAYLEQIGLPHVGSFIDEADHQKLRIINKNGIRIAFLSYTYGTNGIHIPKGKNFLVNIIDKNAMKEEIHRAKSNADVVVMSLHWGKEYQRIPTKDQKDLAQFLANEGADIIFGSHPHVLQPMEWIKTKDGRKSFVIYSLGNFISAQHGDYKDIGGLATIDIIKQFSNNNSKLEMTNPVFTPTYVSNQKNHHFGIVPLDKAENYGLANAKAKYNEIQHHMYQWLKD
ncbi:CapA family protein [Neobacillus cucumis]|uniref:Capsular biosynthesis protein n=1 Tax=Neobacillus cucumis TaxID=1740721 RepID=A0A2N5HVG6_9BACI|nr:CapA family protein [Neobacillus cucumis]PLS09514.1 capsular biosynthesis protein [Neobacillus cucumis]